MQTYLARLCWHWRKRAGQGARGYPGHSFPVYLFPPVVLAVPPYGSLLGASLTEAVPTFIKNTFFTLREC